MRPLASYDFPAIVSNRSRHLARAGLHRLGTLGHWARRTTGLTVFGVFLVLSAIAAFPAILLETVARLALPREYQRYLNDD